MLTGRAPFAGATVSDTIAAVLGREPDWTLLPSATPPAVRRLLERSLRRDQKDRLRDIGDVRNELSDALGSLASPVSRRASVRRLAGAIAVVALAIAAGTYLLSRRPAADSAGRSAVDGTFSQLTSSPGIEWFPSMSPDGRWVIWTLPAAGGPPALVATGAGSYWNPAWSPDGTFVYFSSDRGGSMNLWRVPIEERSGRILGDLQQITDLEGGGMYTAWSPDGSSIASTKGPLGQLTAPSYIFDTTRPWKAQTPRMLPTFEPPNGFFVVNTWSPDGERIAGSAGLDGKGVVIYSLRSNGYERLTDYGEWPVWFPDSRRILFVSGGRDFFTIDSRTKEVRKIYSSTRDVLGPPRLSREGREMYFSRRVTESDVWTLTLK